MSNPRLPLIVLLGPTASGKTSLAVALAANLQAEIISADSRQLYKNLDIGTGKDLNEYQLNDQQIPIHLIDTLEIGTPYSVAHFQFDAFHKILEIENRNNPVIICGGSGLYIESLLKDYTFSELPPFLEKSIELNRKFIVFGLEPPYEERRERCANRLMSRIEEGLIDEGERLLQMGVSFEQLRWLGLEYKWLADLLEGKINKDAFIKGLTIAIQQYAKRQMTFFRKMEKNGIVIHWIPFSLSKKQRVEWMKKYIF
ncbi:MAG: tRNA dimethylallyltransferase [Bacteroidota bacterium]|jgi:tRNA dimethylallyltransferase